MYRRFLVRVANVSETRENLADLLTAVEAGEEVLIMRRDRPVAKLVALKKTMPPFLDRSQLRSEVPPMRTTAEEAVRDQREEERY